MSWSSSVTYVLTAPSVASGPHPLLEGWRDKSRRGEVRPAWRLDRELLRAAAKEASRANRATNEKQPTPSSACYIRFSVRGSITPRRKRVTWPVLEETTREMQLAATLMAAAAAWRLPSPPGRL